MPFIVWRDVGNRARQRHGGVIRGPEIESGREVAGNRATPFRDIALDNAGVLGTEAAFDKSNQ